MRDALTVALGEPIQINEGPHTHRYGRFLGVVRDSIHWFNGQESVLVPVGGGFPNVTDRNGCLLGLEQHDPLPD